MRAAAGCVVVVAAACGRIAFDDVRHDEDGDGVVDNVDVCPHIADPDQLDGDGDGVGDVCDIEPDVPRQRIVLFSPMTDTGAFTTGGMWTQVGDDLVAASDGAGLQAPLPPGGDLEIAVALELLATDPVITEHQVSVGPCVADVPRFYTELYENPTNPAKLAVTHADDAGYINDGIDLLSGYRLGSIRWHAQFGFSSQRITVEVDWPDDTHTLGVPVTGYLGPEQLRLAFNGVQAALHYAIVIETR